jgi:methylglyoxal synthase
MLMRLCNVHDVPLATNYSTAKCVVSFLKKKEIVRNNS